MSFSNGNTVDTTPPAHCPPETAPRRLYFVHALPTLVVPSRSSPHLLAHPSRSPRKIRKAGQDPHSHLITIAPAAIIDDITIGHQGAKSSDASGSQPIKPSLRSHHAFVAHGQLEHATGGRAVAQHSFRENLRPPQNHPRIRGRAALARHTSPAPRRKNLPARPATAPPTTCTLRAARIEITNHPQTLTSHRSPRRLQRLQAFAGAPRTHQRRWPPKSHRILDRTPATCAPHSDPPWSACVRGHQFSNLAAPEWPLGLANVVPPFQSLLLRPPHNQPSLSLQSAAPSRHLFPDIHLASIPTRRPLTRLSAQPAPPIQDGHDELSFLSSRWIAPPQRQLGLDAASNTLPPPPPHGSLPTPTLREKHLILARLLAASPRPRDPRTPQPPTPPTRPSLPAQIHFFRASLPFCDPGGTKRKVRHHPRPWVHPEPCGVGQSPRQNAMARSLGSIPRRNRAGEFFSLHRAPHRRRTIPPPIAPPRLALPRSRGRRFTESRLLRPLSPPEDFCARSQFGTL